MDRAKETEYGYAKPDGSLGDFFRIFASCWLNNNISDTEAEDLQRVFSNAEQAGWKWLEMECALLLATRSKEQWRRL